MAKGIKTGGRTKGTPNLKKTVVEICEAEGCCPIAVMVSICMKDGDQYQFQAAKELASYLYAKKQAIELTGADGGSIKTEGQSSLVDTLIAEHRKVLESLDSETRKLQSSSQKRKS